MSPRRVALLTPYWDFFESSVPGDLRASRRALVERVRAVLAGVAEVAADAVADSRAAGRAAGSAIAEAAPDAVVVVQTLAAPPAFALAALDTLPGVPLVVLALQGPVAGGDGFSHADITASGATVGTPQLTNVLVRRGRRFALVTGLDRLPDAVRAAAAAGRLRGARIGRVGAPIDGYDCVDCDADALRAATGIQLVPIAPGEVGDAFRAADGVPVVEELRAGWEVEAPADVVARSARCAAGLARVAERHALAAGAMNCHVPEIRLGADPGVAPCFALGRETTRGIPWTCAGDVVTAVAMLALKLLGHAAVYHEIEALDSTSGEALLANSGEHDLAFADPSRRPVLAGNPWWPGACARFSPAPGPATLVAFTPHPGAPGGFRFVVAEGELTGRRLPRTGTVSAAFRFDGGDPVERAWERWVLAGANHHGAATLGRRGAELAAVAGHLGIGCVST